MPILRVRKNKNILMITRLKNSLSLLFFSIGLGALAYLIHKIGWNEIAILFQHLGINLIWIILFPGISYFFQSLAWYRILQDDNHPVSLGHVFLNKITGETINTITPAGFMGGDSYRIYLLQKKLSGTVSTASVVVDRTIFTISTFLFLLSSFIMTWFVLPLPPLWQKAFPMILATLLILIVFLVRSQKKGLFYFTSQLLQKCHIQKSRLVQWNERLQTLDHLIGAFYRKHKLHFFEILAFHLIARILGICEIYLIVQLLELPVTWVHCVFLSSLTILINIVFVFIPGSLGVMEGSYGALFYVLKLSPVYGVAIQLVRRVRTFAWIFVGLLIILLYRPKKIIVSS